MRITSTIKRHVRHVINGLGFDIVQLGPDRLGENPIKDMRTFLRNDHPVVFDVGANVGQSVEWFRRSFPQCFIHSFEPSPAAFKLLQVNVARYRDLRLWNCALGSTSGRQLFNENSSGDMSSFLDLGPCGWGQIMTQTDVPVRTVDDICEEESIPRIDILKIDTQGFDLDVLKGSEKMIRGGNIDLVYVEINFCELYKNAPTISQIYDFMTHRGFVLATFYHCTYHNGVACDLNALFVVKGAMHSS